VILSDSRRKHIDPHKLGQSLRGELDWIVMKALEKDRNRRYETASSFAADVERFLADEPVQARAASPGYRPAAGTSDGKGHPTTRAAVFQVRDGGCSLDSRQFTSIVSRKV